MTIFAGLACLAPLVGHEVLRQVCPDLKARSDPAYRELVVWFGSWAAVAAIQYRVIRVGGAFNILSVAMLLTSVIYLMETTPILSAMWLDCNWEDWKEFLDNQGWLWLGFMAVLALTILTMLIFQTIKMAIVDWRAR